MIRQIREAVARRRGVELESGFTLIELLIVIVVLGILAATVIFALSGVTSQSAQAACQSDARSYEVAAAAFQNSPSNTSNTAAATTNDLITGAGGPYLHGAANNTAYVVGLTGDTYTAASTTGVKNAGGVTLPNPLPTATDKVLVGPAGGTLVPFDDETSTNGCNSKNL
jgi:prepilin-type N-terminal cleavage/methylation domain-containing protein